MLLPQLVRLPTQINYDYPTFKTMYIQH